jgi:uncharacterized protein YndB with AHSA1/START domain
MRFEHEITIDRSPEAVFAVLTDTERLAEWQPTTVEVRRGATGPLARGERFGEVHKAMGRRLESTFEVAEYEPGRLFALHAVDGPMLLDGRWELDPQDGGATLLRFVGEGPVKGPLRLVEGPLTRSMDKRFRGYHETLKRLVESA